MGSAATKRTRRARTNTKPTTGQLSPREVVEVDPEEAKQKMYASLLARFTKRRPGRLAPVTAQGERALRRALVLADRRAGKDRARANGKRG